MSDIFFVLKIMVVTFVLVLLLQIKLGDDTLENQALFAVRDSAVASEIQALGVGGWKELRKNIAALATSIGQAFNGKDERLSIFKFGRSDAHKEAESRRAEAREAARAAVDKAIESDDGDSLPEIDPEAP